MPEDSNNIGLIDIKVLDKIKSSYRPFMDEIEIAAISAAFSLSVNPVSVLEWGSGNSTIYFSTMLQQGSRWDAVEHNRDWALQIVRTVRQLGLSGIQLHYIPNSAPFRDGIDDGDFSSFKEYILFPVSLRRKFDYVLVDGRARIECMLTGWEMLSDGGLMILHDAEREEYNDGIPEKSHQLRMTNPFLPGGRSVLFIAREVALLKNLANSLDLLLPEKILLASDVKDIALTQRSSRAMQLFAEYLHSNGDTASALNVLQQAVDIDPDSSGVLNSLGLILSEIGQFDSALIAFRLALEINPSDQMITINASKAALENGQPELARAWIESYLLDHEDALMHGLLDQLQGKASMSAVTVESISSIKSELISRQSNRGFDAKNSCVFVNTYYPKFLENHYQINKNLNTASYQVQLAALQATCFGDSNFYSVGLKDCGWDADDIIVNCDFLQQAWASESKICASGLDIAVEQIRSAGPDVVYLQDLNLATSDFLNAIRPYTRLIVGQIASAVPHHAKLSAFDIVFSSFPHFVERFRSQGLTAYYQSLAFSAQVLDALPSYSRDIPVSFVGGISPAHTEGLKFLEYLASNVNIGFWGYGRESLSLSSSILPQHHGEVWGLDMFGLLKRSLITVNRHIDVAGHNANNMRLFEATGCGALLITDYKDNLSDLFEIGREVVAYRDPEECVTMIHYYLAHPDEAATIAAAGQARTLRDHFYNGNMKQSTQILARHLRYKNESNSFTASEMAGVASVKIGIESSEVTDSLRSGWQNETIPRRQRALVQYELSEMYAGRAPRVFQIAAAAMYSLLDTGDSVLEIGCASGYYSEVLEYLLNINIDYIGVDYSAALISQAKDYYPNFRFEMADATSLPFSDKSIKVVFSSAVMMHIENYQAHLDELMRVASEYIVLHRTPVFLDQSTKFFTKKAYGVDVVELCFSQVELIEKFISARWKMIAAYELAANPVLGENEMTYVFARN